MIVIKHVECGTENLTWLEPTAVEMLAAGHPTEVPCRSCGAWMNVRQRKEDIGVDGENGVATGKTLLRGEHPSPSVEAGGAGPAQGSTQPGSPLVGCLVLLGGVALLGWLVYYFVFADTGNGEAGARAICEEFVERGLDYPDEADFSGADGIQTGDTTWRVTGDVAAATRVVGEQIRYEYVCEVEYQDNDEWELTSDLDLR